MDWKSRATIKKCFNCPWRSPILIWCNHEEWFFFKVHPNSKMRIPRTIKVHPNHLLNWTFSFRKKHEKIAVNTKVRDVQAVLVFSGTAWNEKTESKVTNQRVKKPKIIFGLNKLDTKLSSLLVSSLSKRWENGIKRMHKNIAK